MADRPKILIVGPEPIWKSIVRDTYSAAMIFTVIGVGVYLESSAMQWVGFIMAFILLFGASGRLAKADTYEGQDAIDRVIEIVRDERGVK